LFATFFIVELFIVNGGPAVYKTLKTDGSKQ